MQGLFFTLVSDSIKFTQCLLLSREIELKETGKRWLDLLLVLSISSIILVLLLEYTRLPISNWLSQQNTLYRSLIIFLVSTCLWGFIYKTGGIRVSDLNPVSYFKYPPIWLTSVIWSFPLFFLINTFLLKNAPTLQPLSNRIINMAVFFAAGIAVTLYHLTSKPRPKKNVAVKNQSFDRENILSDPKKIIEWVSTENPINDETEDLFHHKYIARKIREIIDEGSNKNIGVVGGYGSGKSSIINLIISEQPANKIFCKIEGWGFKENTAIEHILQLVIEELKLHFDCLSIANLPKQYHEAMNNSGNNILPVIGCFFQGTRNPINILEKIDSILECLDRKLFIVLEDIDRNIVDATFYNEIASFLNVTKKLNRISFIIAMGPKHNLGAILTKLCEHNEYIQRIDKKEIVSICDVLAANWHALYPDDIVIQDYEIIKKFLGIPQDNREEHLMQMLSRKKPIDYVSELLDTPRKLKSAMRETNISWQRLHGETAFIYIFLSSILKTAAPEAYTFINNNGSELRKSDSNSKSATEDGKSTKLLTEKWEQITENVSWDIEAARKIICVLFPVFRQNKQDEDISSLVSKKNLQSSMDDSSGDYWKRINIGRLLPDEIADQVILKAIEGWRNDHLQKTYSHNEIILSLPEAILEVDDLDDKFEKFGFLLKPKEIYELASELFKKASKKEGNNASEESCPGFINLWRLSLKNDYSGQEDWLINEIEKALDISLHFSNDLYYYWKFQRDYDVDAKLPTPKLRKRTVDVFQKKFEANPKCLCDVLSQNNPWGLYHMVFMSREQDTEEWRWLGKILLEASQVNQKLLASYIACLISDTELKHSSDSKIGTYYNNKINTDHFKEIFGGNTKAVMKLLSMEFEYPELADNYKHAQSKSVIQSAREEAKTWLKKTETE